MSKGKTRFSRLGVLAPVALSACIDASVLAAPAAGAILSTVLKELSKAFMLKKWFHGKMSAREAEHLLMQKGKNGSYLVRESQTYPGEYVLSVRASNRVSHVMIGREHNKYNVGSGEIFDDLTGLVEHCRAYPLTEASGEVLRLKQPVNGTRPTARNTREPTLEKQTEDEMDPDHGFYDYMENNEQSEDETARGINLGDFVYILQTLDNMNLDGETLSAALHLAATAFVEAAEENLDDFMDVELRWLKETENVNKFTCIVGLLPENVNRNRYGNIIPYDETRVVIPLYHTGFNNMFSDYINASYIKPLKMFLEWRSNFTSQPHNGKFSKPKGPAAGPLFKVHGRNRSGSRNAAAVVKNKFYIAAQGCLSETEGNFWSMVVNEDIRVIVMLANIAERDVIKCSQYWPEIGNTVRYGDIEVTTFREYYHPDYMAREISIRKPDKRRVSIYHYQFLTWPDNRTPKETRGIMRLMKDVNDRMQWLSKQKPAPRQNVMCVHCSAGVGRTGTFIAIDMILDIVKVEGNLDITINVYEIVKNIRAQRPGMVRNKRQYEFIYMALEDYIKEARSGVYQPYSAVGNNPRGGPFVSF